jgi:hypothetical protein
MVRMNRTHGAHLLWLAPLVLLAQAKKAPQPKPLEAQSSSTLKYATDADGAQFFEIHNVAYEMATNIPGRPPADWLVLRKTTHSKEVIGDIGVQATVTLEAWPLGSDLKQKPLYTLNASGTDGHTQDSAVFVVSRGLEEVEWWSVYKLGTGQHLFDTYVPLLSFSISRDTVETRYAGLEVPEDDAKDARLKQPNVIAVITYSSADNVLHEALLTSDSRDQAALLRSFADETRTLVLEERGSSLALKLSFRQNYPSPPNPLAVIVPIAKDDLDLAHAQLPPKVHLTAWKRYQFLVSVRSATAGICVTIKATASLTRNEKRFWISSSTSNLPSTSSKPSRATA